ncbi:MAG: glycoside hydrolase family 32 protein [Saprospiraceae bacterium]|nr:glycoside hydrolase family 32 protein [Saprospiraceae bacterium]
MKNAILTLPLIYIGCAICGCNTPSSPSNKEALEYSEPHRPQFHFSPKEKWMNDPNGMFFYEGEYHLFYQFYPDSNVWGPMHWGHAVSKDLTHWEHLPIALYPDSLGYIFSGSAVVDWKNTSGLGHGASGQPPIVAIFTYHDMEAEKAGRSDYQCQGIAFSHDKGRTWTKYEGNPVLPNPKQIRDFRDPKVRWDERSAQWVMALAAYDHIQFWGSPDLKKWRHLSDFGKEWGVHGGVWECPDLFPIVVEGTNDTRWVLLVSINPGGANGGSATQYFVGDFDGQHFKLDDSFVPLVRDEKAIWLDYGRDNYAGVTWSDIPNDDGRRLFMGWMSNWDYATAVPTAVWRSAMTLPRVLTLNKTSAGYRVFSHPVEALKQLRTTRRRLEPIEITGTLDLTKTIGFSPSQMELMLEFEVDPGTAVDFGVELSNAKGGRYRIGYNAGTALYSSDRTQSGEVAFSEKFANSVHTAPRVSADKNIRLHLFFDVSSAELFADNGATALTDIFFPRENFSTIKIYAENGKVKLANGEAHALKRIWR